MKGLLSKMKAELKDSVQYHLPINDELIHLNPFIGKNISLEFTGNIFCQACHKATKKSFNQGYCYGCFIKLASCDMCILKPETCHFELGTCREPEWAKQHCFQDHFVYLANSSGLKVGITRHTQIPTRWIDQGATQALAIAKVLARKDSGIAESKLKSIFADKTDWRKMLKGASEPIDLKEKAEEAKKIWPSDIKADFNLDQTIVEINYPVLSYPQKITSLNAEKKPLICGDLLGIKGQYLILSTGVINIRKYTSYEILWH